MRDLLRRYKLLFYMILLLLLTLILYSYNLRQKAATSFFERAVLSLAAPFQIAIDGGVDSVIAIWNNYFWLVDTRQRNLELERENLKLRSQLRETREISLQNERLRHLLGFVDELDRPALPAQIIGEDVSHWARTLVIDKGSGSGLRNGLPVVAAEGVVGRIIKIGPESSRVLLITDASSAVASLVQRTRTRSIARGRGQELAVNYALGDRDVRVGDLLVTSGMGGVFPKGLPLGLVTTVQRDPFTLFLKIRAEPTVDFSHLEEVMVIVRPDEEQ